MLVAAIAPAVWAFLKKESNKLDLAITLLALFGIAWLIWVANASILYGVPLLAFALIAVKWTVREQAQANRLLGFFVKTFTLFLFGTRVANFIFWLNARAILATAIYTSIAFLANHRAQSKVTDALRLPVLGCFYLFLVIWYFVKAVVLEYLGERAEFTKIPHNASGLFGL